ncbi:cytochrome P450 [Streptomyces sp. NPDC055287]
MAQRLRPGLIPRLVEEVYRWAPLLGDSLPRVATEDLDIGHAQVEAGQLVMISTDAANHDPTVFPEPERLDIDRDAAPHLRRAAQEPVEWRERHAVLMPTRIPVRW